MFIDDRAGSAELMKYPAIAAVAELTRLEFGDVAIVGNGAGDEPTLVGVELKSIWDLVSSINTGRLQATQVPGMLALYQIRWLLFFGGYRPGRDGTLELAKGASWRTMRLGSRIVPYGYVEALLLDLAAVGFNVKHVDTEAAAAQWLLVLNRWWLKPHNKHRGLHKFDESGQPSLLPQMDDITHLMARVAKELPGLGFERALAAARHFGSVEHMINAEVGEWREIPGVGPVIAKAVVDVIRRNRL